MVKVNEIANTAPVGEVLSQTPEGGTMAENGAEVTLTVSAGGQSTVPQVTGMTEELAIQTLDGAGFNVDVRYGADGTSVGVVYHQDPSADSLGEEGDTVTITVQGVRVQWDESTTPQELQSRLQGEGLSVKIEGDPEGTIIESVSGPNGGLNSGDVVRPGGEITVTAASEDGGGEDPTDDPTSCGPLEPGCDEDGEGE